MSTDKIDPSKKDATISSADDVVKTTKSGEVELSEKELKRVLAAPTAVSMQGYTLNMTLRARKRLTSSD